MLLALGVALSVVAAAAGISFLGCQELECVAYAGALVVSGTLAVAALAAFSWVRRAGRSALPFWFWPLALADALLVLWYLRATGWL